MAEVSQLKWICTIYYYISDTEMLKDYGYQDLKIPNPLNLPFTPQLILIGGV